MDSKTPFVEIKTSSGKASRRGEVTITPEAQALMVRLPFWGFVWNRPVAVVVEENGRRERYPIIDVTRTAVWALAGAGMLMSLLFVLVGFLLRGRETENG